MLIVAGGRGPINAGPIARELEIPLVMIPRESSVFCAAGMLISDLQHEYVRTFARDIDKVDLAEASRLVRDMTSSATKKLADEGVAARQVKISYSMDLRYVGQFNEVEVPVEFGRGITAKLLAGIVAAFHERHDSLYGYSIRGMPVDLITLRVPPPGLTPTDPDRS